MSLPQRPPQRTAPTPHPLRAAALRLAVAAGASSTLTGCPQLLDDNFAGEASRQTSNVDPGASDPGGSSSSSTTVPASPGQSTGTVAGGGAGQSTSTGDGAGGEQTATPDASAPIAEGGSSSGGSGGTGGVAGAGSSTPEGGAGAGGDAAGGSGGSSGETNGCETAQEYCDGRDNDCDDEVDEDGCPDGCEAFTFEDHGYMACEGPATWEAAEAACIAEGMYLAEIGSSEENSTLLDNAPSTTGWNGGGTFGGFGGANGPDRDAAWIGAVASSDHSEWRWVTSDVLFWSGAANGSAVDGAYENWSSTQPDNDGGESCGALYVEDDDPADASEWNDVPCDFQLLYFCEAD